MTYLLALPLALLLLGLSACSGDDEDVPATTPPGETPVPHREPGGGTSIVPAPLAHLKATSANVDAEGGTRCWGNMCIDYVGPITSPQPTGVPAGQPLTVDYDAGVPTEVTYTWHSPTGMPQATNTGAVSWSFPTAAGGTPATSPLTAPTAPGKYILNAFAQWSGRGDISYAWYIEVR